MLQPIFHFLFNKTGFYKHLFGQNCKKKYFFSISRFFKNLEGTFVVRDVAIFMQNFPLLRLVKRTSNSAKLNMKRGWTLLAFWYVIYDEKRMLNPSFDLDRRSSHCQKSRKPRIVSPFYIYSCCRFWPWRTGFSWKTVIISDYCRFNSFVR